MTIIIIVMRRARSTGSTASTSLISAVASLLTGGLTVGQPLPMGYSTYNVPMAYRSSYYDTPDTWYRYNNGYIY